MHISNQEFQQLADYIKANYGIYLKKEKETLVVGRLKQVLTDLNLETFTEYLNYLRTDLSGKAVMTLVDKITTNHTFFMREAEHFDFFRDTVLPFLVSTNRDKDLRIWSAGCSSGEEPYTLALIIAEFFQGKKEGWDTKVLATDLSNSILETASQGIYSQEKIATLPPLWRVNYFQKIDHDRFCVIDSIRKEVIFRRFNLIQPTFPFKKKFDVIFCRNVMIYFDEQTKNNLVQKFYEFTNPGGYLFIGHSESLNRNKTGYQYILPAVYRKE